MRKYLPKNDTIKEEYKNMTIYSNLNVVNIWLHKNDELDFTDLLKVLNKYDNKLINIGNIYSRNVFNRLIYTLKNYDYDGRVVFDLLDNDYEDDRINIISGIENYKKINIEALPKYVKISGFDASNKQTEFTTWAHNLNIKDKKILIEKLTSSSLDRFLEQEKVIINFKKEIFSKYPNFNKLKQKEKMDLLYEYIRVNFPFSFRDFRKEYISSWAQNPIEVYRLREGINMGRTNLLTLVSNNSILKVNCTSAEGYKNGYKHTWNQYVDSDKIIHNYDLSFSLKDIGIRGIKKLGFKVDRMYPAVIKCIKSSVMKPKKRMVLKNTNNR